MDERFRDIEAAFREIKSRFKAGALSQREFIDRLKQLRLKDENGRFWMIGAQSGKWYFFDGKDWVQAEPPSFREKKAICIFCGYENDLLAEACGRCGGRFGEEEEVRCPDCGAALSGPAGRCPSCSAGVPAVVTSDGAAAIPLPSAAMPGELVLRSVRTFSFVLFSGAVGVVAGVLAGLIVGVTNLYPGFAAALPAFFQDIQGKLVGGIVFAILGGVLGFAVLALLGLFLVGLLNLLLSFTGGLRFRLDGATAPDEEA